MERLDTVSQLELEVFTPVAPSEILVNMIEPVNGVNHGAMVQS